MSESYTLFLNTANPINFTNLQPAQGVCDVQFYIIWDAFLPQEYKKFEVTASLKSATSGVALSALCFVELNFGSGTSYDQSMIQRSITLPILPSSYITGVGTSRQYFNNIKDDKGYLQINRPTDNNLRVRIMNQYDSIASGFIHFTLRLKFTPIID